MSKYRKAIVAAVLGIAIAGLLAVKVALGDGVITPLEWVAIALALTQAGAVYQVPNAPADSPPSS